MSSPSSSIKGTVGRHGQAVARPIAASLRPPASHVVAIDDSHSRCSALGVSRFETPDLSPLGRSDLTVLRDRNARMFSHAAPVMDMLFDQIMHTQSMVVLCDVTGTVLHSLGDDDFLVRASKVALQPGANWSESTKGTNAVGTALVAEKPMLVHADEHFVHANHFLTCSAAPILDPRGNVVGVLDVSGDHRSYHQHTMALVKMSARMIENHWLSEDYRHVMRLHFHSRASVIGTLNEGILAVTAEGRIVGANRSALDYLGMSGASLRMQTLESVFNVSVGSLVNHFRSPLATPFAARTANADVVHLFARFDWPVWHTIAEATALASSAAPIPSTAPEASGAFASQRKSEDEALATPPAAPGLELFSTADPGMASVVDKARRFADLHGPVLILGETGVGKGLLARALHQSSKRRDKPFLVINCAALTPTLLDQLFAGAGASSPQAPMQTHVDPLAHAHGGTIFLDEVGDMSLDAQVRLLAYLRADADRRQDSGATLPNDVALISATQRPLRASVADGHFREDLLYRLNCLTLKLPALRERSDLLALAQQLLAREGGKPPLVLSLQAQVLVQAYPWPGNVRQLINVLRAASAMAQGHALIEPRHLPDELLEDARALVPSLASAGDGQLPAPPLAPHHTLDAIESEAIQAAVRDCDGNISLAAKRLGISRNTIYRKLRWQTPAIQGE